MTPWNARHVKLFFDNHTFLFFSAFRRATIRDECKINSLEELNTLRVSHSTGQVPLGGMGVISATVIASSAFISSKLSCANLEASLLSASLPLSPHPHLNLCQPLQVLSMPSPTGKLPTTLMIPLHPHEESGLWLSLEISSSHFLVRLSMPRMRPGS